MLHVVTDPRSTTRPSTRPTTAAPPDGSPPDAAAPSQDAPPTKLVVASWWDPDLARSGVDPRGEYAERFWLGIAGPSTLLLLRRLARGLAEHPGGIRIDLADTARALGLGAGTGRNAPIVRTVERACQFGLARRPEPERLEVRSHLPRLQARHVARLPLALQQAHEAWVAEHPTGPAPSRPAAAPHRPDGPAAA